VDDTIIRSSKTTLGNIDEMICEECGYVNPSESAHCENCGAKMYRASLKIILENGTKAIHYLKPQNYRIGRGRRNDIIIKDASVSRYHAELEYKDEGFSIIDKDSKNGSFLNDEHFTYKRLDDSDCIQLGDVLIHFYDEKHNLPQSGDIAGTDEFVEKEFFKLAENRRNKIAISEVLLTMLDLALSLTQAKYGLIFQFNQANKLKLRLGKNTKGKFISQDKLALSDWRIISEAIKTQNTKTKFEKKQSGGRNGHPVEYLEWKKMAIPLIASMADSENEDLGNKGILGICFLEQDKKILISKKRRSLLNALVHEISLAIENEMLYGEAIERRKIRDELSLASEIQQKLLPTAHPQIKDFEFGSFIQPCKEISGDYFDIIPISDQFIAVAIGDICGKGMPAALLSSTVQAAIRSQVDYTTSPDQIVRNLNRLLMQNTADSIFLTLFFGILNIDSSEFDYINAGHPPPIVISQNLTITELAGSTAALGIIEAEIPQRTIKFESGDLLLMYTDGIIESQNKQKRIYSRKKFLNLINEIFSDKKSQKIKLNSIIDTVKQDILNYTNGAEQMDDLTLLAVRRK